MTFEAWWTEFWDPLSGPPVTNLMFKEVAQAAWEAAKQEFKPPKPAPSIPRLMEMPE